MADKTVYVDGTTSSGHYATLQAAITGEVSANADLTAAGMNGILHIEISLADADTTAGTTVNGFTTDATHYVHIYTDAANRASASWSDSKYRLYSSNQYGLVIQDANVWIDGLQIANHSPTTTNKHVVVVSGGEAGTLWISNCLLRGHGNSSYAQTGIYSNLASHAFSLWNTIVYNIPAITNARGIDFAGSGATLNARNCVFIGGDYAMNRFSGTVTAKNCYAGGANTGDFGGTITKTNCASEDTTAGSSDGCISGVALDTDTFVAVASGSEDFHLAADGNSPLQAAGTDTTGESAPLDFTTDIDGETRQTAAWDIGADGIPAATGQFARPASTVAAGNWTYTGAASLHAALSETTASDSEYATSGPSPSNDTMTLGLSSIAAPTSGTCTLRVQARYV